MSLLQQVYERNARAYIRFTLVPAESKGVVSCERTVSCKAGINRL